MITNEEGYVKDLVFYYPISPKSAIIIEFGKEHGYTVETIKADDTFVDKYNSLIANNSQQFLFANDVSILETYLKW